MAFYFAPFLSLFYVLMAHRLGAVALFATLPLLAGSFALLDAVFGAARRVAPANGRGRGRLLPWLYIPLQVVVTLTGAVAAAQATTGLVTLVGSALAVGTVAGIFGMLAAHEMIHSGHRVERALGLAMLAATTYMHFRLSHIHSHHRHAATQADPATARRGESVYRFFLRSVAGQFCVALEMERVRSSRGGRPWLGNRVYHYAVVSAVIYLALMAGLGLRAVAFFALQSLVAVFVLELFNYVVHYGLCRRRLPDGRREPLSDRHSWNAPQRFTNWGLMNGGYHSDHHRHPARAYVALALDRPAPELPMGYAGTMIAALMPPLWRAIMHPRLARVAAGRISAAA